MSGQVSIDKLKTHKSHIDLSDPQLPTDFGLDEYELSFIFDDVILVEYIDVKSGVAGDYIMRGSIAVPVNMINSAWRKGQVILAGPNVKYAKKGDIVVFPNNMGIPIKNVEVKDHGPIRDGLFLNEQRMFGICNPTEEKASEEAVD